jgi:hypothetical protein
MCKRDGCSIQPHYNLPNEKKPLYCFTHKDANMVNVKCIICIYPECKTRASFNIEGETKPLYCATHKLENMINIMSATCLHEGCRTRPHYNVEGETKPLYCVTHKLENMINVKSATCLHEGCRTRPCYNVEGETKPLYCATHKLENMINIMSATCLHEGCRIQPHYNVEGETKPLYCATHKLENMINIMSATCLHEGCRIQPCYNVEGETKPLYCATHKLENMVNVKDRTCNSEWCFTRVHGKYDGYCLYCYINLFPDKPVSRNYKTKEYSVVEFVKNKWPEYNWVADKIISGGCSKRRPDLLLDLGYQVIIVEIDENQHIDYDCSCENKRIMELSQDLGHRPIVFIRFNPDDYKINDKNITSCWGINKNGICAVKKSKTNEWIQRLKTLEDQIQYWINPENRTNKTIEVLQLFYDNGME